jgi:hypothetical protein
VDTAALAAAVRAGRWSEAGPWLALLAGFGLVLAGMICFFWLSAQVSGNLEDRWLIVPLGAGLAWFLWQRFAAQRGFALGLIAALAVLTQGLSLTTGPALWAWQRRFAVGFFDNVEGVLEGRGVGEDSSLLPGIHAWRNRKREV